MKKYGNLLCCLWIALATHCLYSQQRFLTRSGIIEFDSKLDSFVPVKAKNNSVSAILNSKTGDIAVLAFVSAFNFKNALMQEHFNESYAESDKFPKATFTGRIANFRPSSSSIYYFNGILSFHGIQKTLRSIPLDVVFKENIVQISGELPLYVADFDIKVPKIVSRKIPEKIFVSIDLSLEKAHK